MGSRDRVEERVGDLVDEMGRERRALRARGAAVTLLRGSAFVCLAAALAGFSGYVLPYAPMPSAVLMVAAVSGFVVSVLFERGILDADEPALEERRGHDGSRR